MKIKKVLFIPGLNLHPDQMHKFAQLLPYDAETITLPGIDPHHKQATIQDFNQWAQFVEDKLNTNDYDALVGFSLGGLILANLLKQKKIQNKPVILIAPALRIFKHSWMLEKVFKLTKLPSMISLQKSQFIVHRFTPRGLYLALYQGVRQLGDDLSFLKEHKILCLLHKKDELVWTNKIKNELDQLNSNQIKLQILEHRPVLGPYLHHLCFHPDNLTNNDFQALTNTLTQFLDS